jgi:hypothetical protein
MMGGGGTIQIASWSSSNSRSVATVGQPLDYLVKQLNFSRAAIIV